MSMGRVLLVDDEPELVAGIHQALEGVGLEVLVRPSLITLPLEIRSIDPDVVLLDVSMPGLSATTALSNERFRLKTRAAVILFSGRGEHELRKLTEELGADGFICKSADTKTIIYRVKTWARFKRRERTA